MLKDATEVWGRMRVVLLEPARQLIRGVSRGRSHERRAEAGAAVIRLRFSPETVCKTAQGL
jgi:hypothetical protein